MNIKPFILLIVKLSVKMKVMDELKDIGPSLSNIKKDTPFTVPDGYFSNFQTRLDTESMPGKRHEPVQKDTP